MLEKHAEDALMSGGGHFLFSQPLFLSYVLNSFDYSYLRSANNFSPPSQPPPYTRTSPNAVSPPYRSPRRCPSNRLLEDRSNIDRDAEEERAAQREKERERVLALQDTPSRRHRRTPNRTQNENRDVSPTPPVCTLKMVHNYFYQRHLILNIPLGLDLTSANPAGIARTFNRTRTSNIHPSPNKAQQQGNQAPPPLLQGVSSRTEG
ncbi:hypothetical protein GGX14DRAFT_568407 [Mycena pura]|uniref:Uncharacterized protein n=1 Tax=Mycena pura TaxID=153505 RepID=A0AAD6YAL6_9AGAR|nr:hypothetical protein GGX14DRAFT_568407 [Mycena pura]